MRIRFSFRVTAYYGRKRISDERHYDVFRQQYQKVKRKIIKPIIIYEPKTIHQCLLVCLLPFMAQAQQIAFRFAQLTDIHLSPSNPNPTEDLLRSIAQINATDSIDFVLVTGDITEEGDRATMEKVKSCLDLLKVKYYVALGNHETKWSDSGCTAFGEIFGGERFDFEHKGFLFLGFNSGP